MASPLQRSPNYSGESDDSEEDVNVRRQFLDGESEKPLNCYLIGIDLFNFKSYSGHHIIGPFTNVTAIIGPNGSGKSNLMEAISFSLCMKSDKLRAKNIGSLVSTHDEGETSSAESQSAKDTRVKAYVKLIFVPRNKKGDCTEEDRTTVERRILQDNSCEYAIDGIVCPSQGPYMQFLTRLGLNARNKIFLLFQGTVDSLVTKNSTAFTKIIEELSGSTQFVKSYDKLKDKLKDYEQQLHGLQSQKQSFQKSKGFVKNLQRQRDMNVDIIEEIEEIKVQMILLDLKKQSRIIEHALEKLTEENEALTEIEDEISVLEVKKVEKKKTFDEIEQAAQKIARKYRQSDLSLACQEKHDVQKLESQRKASRIRLKNATKNRDSFRLKKEGSQNAIQILKDRMEDLDKKISELSERLNSRGDKLHITRQQVDEFNRLKNEFQQQLSDLSGYQAARDQGRHLKFLEQKLALFEDKKSNNDNEIKSLESKVAINNTIIEKLSQDIANFSEMLKESEKLKEAKTKELNDLIGKAKSDEKNMKEKRESLKKMYESMTQKQQRKASDVVLEHLKNAYPGRVHGRFGELCLPENPKYRRAFRIVAGQYARAILVDSFDTVKDILSREPRSVYQSETIIALDRINAPDLKPELREIKFDVHLMFDIVKKPKEIARIEMAIRLAIGSTLVCTSRESARQVAYHENPNRHFNAISATCGTYFKANGEISANFDRNNKKDDFDEDSYYKEELEFKENEQKYIIAQDKLADLKTKLEPINAENLRLRTHLNIAKKHIEELKKQNSDNEDKISQLKSALVEEAEQNDIEPLKIDIQMLKMRLGEFEEEKRAIKARVFQDFLSQIGGGNFADVESFELAYYQDHEKDIFELDKLQKERENLALEMLDIENKNNDAAIWENAVEEEKKKCAKLDEEYAQKRGELDEKEAEYEKLLENGRKKMKEQEAANSELNKVLSDLKSANHRKDVAKSTIQTLTTSMKVARKERHDLYRKAFIDATTLPIMNENLFRQLFANQEVNNVLENEDQLEVNFSLIEEFATSEDNSQDFHRHMFELEKKLKLKENELQTVTIGDNVDLDHEEREAIQNIRHTTKEIDKVRAALSKTRVKYEEVKHHRGRLFRSFLDRVAQNLDRFYKELTGNVTSQAFLIVEDQEEPYLFGVNYSCIAPGKSFQSMAHLSGGEKCLAAFAFIFSVYSDHFPSFFIMDEIDGPLDTDNINKLVSFMQGKSDRTQFICISHKINLFGSVNSLIGVTRYNFLNANTHAKSEAFSLDLRPYHRQEKDINSC